MLHQPFDEGRQWQLAHEVAELLGYDFARGRIERSPHPYCSTFGVGDVRMTLRTLPDFFNPCFFACCHETGHALYNQALPAEYARTPLFRGASSMVHESQSRLWENLVGRSRPFWSYYYPHVQATFPEALGDVPVEAFYKAVNRVQPSLIRIEADEITYNLHIMLRFELELALLDGSLEVADLPRRWNELMEETLGVVPPTDAMGVMQDMHWGAGMFGYFPTYTLGNVLSVQLWEAARADLPDLDAQIGRGDFAPLLGWMSEHIHRYGRLYPPMELIERATGQPLTAEPYLAYLRAKYGDIYSL